MTIWSWPRSREHKQITLCVNAKLFKLHLFCDLVNRCHCNQFNRDHLLHGFTWKMLNKFPEMQITTRNANNSETWRRDMVVARSFATRCSRDLVFHQHKHLWLPQNARRFAHRFCVVTTKLLNRRMVSLWHFTMSACTILLGYVPVAPATFVRQKFNRIACDNLFWETAKISPSVLHLPLSHS